MSDEIIYPIPSLKEIQEAGTQGFVLQVGPDQGLKVDVLGVREGIAMNRDYEGYSLLLVLPQGVALPQAVFNLFGPGREQPWQLLMTPLLPEADGRHVLEAVVHRKREIAQSATV
ncbi:hypothetical protein [Stutzerimonas stutzeri]|uniref:hypothetical protein n=1 Tax=Stutzerimonas stutzeri TaxID=316 RepID=UPI00210CA7B3|nr:hypothetical protein [Stutzerimonas stutzeri]MCQ4319488.1 hypothetical protein [Stutzerimonas stutzeri]